MPLIAASHFFAFSAGIRLGDAGFRGLGGAPNGFVSALAMSTSKPVILPPDVTYSIGGNVGSVQNVNVALVRAPAAPAATAVATSASMRITLRMDFSSVIAWVLEPSPKARG